MPPRIVPAHLPAAGGCDRGTGFIGHDQAMTTPAYRLHRG